MQPMLRLDRRTQHTLSPRLQYAVRLLQMSSMDFVGELRDLADRNPFLDIDIEPADAVVVPVRDAGAFARADDTVAMSPPEKADDGEHDRWQFDGRAPRRQSEDDSPDPLDLLAARVDLRAHLHAQLDLSSMPTRELLLAKVVVESIDEDGYLRQPLHELVGPGEFDFPPEPQEMRAALCRVQSLDPAGVGARSVGECLLLQIPTIVDPRQRECARLIVRDHLDSLAARDIPSLAHALGESPDFVEGVCERIRRLDPRPGWRFDHACADYVIPDVVVRKAHGRWTASLNPAIVPRLSLNRAYADLFRCHAGASHPGLAAQLQQARWTLRNVDQRFHTILTVAQAIVQRQWRVFELGDMAMRPLGLKEIADEAGMHESTVSRVTNNKYMDTPLGVIELKHFFSRAMVSAHGRAFSGTAIRGLIKEMIAEEPRAAPLSDAQIARMLARQGLQVARRTVTKYRHELRIDPAERRQTLV